MPLFTLFYQNARSQTEMNMKLRGFVSEMGPKSLEQGNYSGYLYGTMPVSRRLFVWE